MPLGGAPAIPVGIAILVGMIAAIALLEWSHLMDLPLHHRVALQVASVVIVASVAVLGTASADWLIGGIVLVHAVLLAKERGELGVTLFAALAVASAGSDVGAFVVGRRFGRHPLAPR